MFKGKIEKKIAGVEAQIDIPSIYVSLARSLSQFC